MDRTEIWKKFAEEAQLLGMCSDTIIWWHLFIPCPEIEQIPPVFQLEMSRFFTISSNEWRIDDTSLKNRMQIEIVEKRMQIPAIYWKSCKNGLWEGGNQPDFPESILIDFPSITVFFY